MFLAQCVRIVTQAGYFILIARTLGVTEFGRLAAALAIVAIAVPFATWGSGSLLIRDVVRDSRSFAFAWGSVLLTIAVVGSGLVVIATGGGALLLRGIPARLLFVIALSDLVFGRFTDSCTQAFQGFKNLRATSLLLMVPGTVRLAAAVAYISTRGGSAQDWSYWYLGASIVGAFVAGPIVWFRLGAPMFDIPRTLGRMKEGLYFAIGLSSETIYGDIDKAMLSRLSSLGATGIYAAAARAVALAFVPIYSILQATYYRFFAHGESGLVGTITFARRLVVPFVVVGSLAAAGIWLLAPLAPSILGNGFSESVSALRWLAVVPLLQSLYYLAGDTLTGAGFQRARSVMQLGVAVINVGLNLYLIPRYSWRGAAFATLACDLTLIILLWGTVARLVRVRPEARHGR